MDTSSRTQDESIRPMDVVLGKRIRQSQLTVSDWIKLIFGLTAELTARLKYMSDMVEFRRHMNCQEDKRTYSTEPDILANVSEFIRPDLRCAKVCDLPCGLRFQHPIYDCHEWQRHDHTLFISDENRFFVVFSGYRVVGEISVHGHVSLNTEKLVARYANIEQFELTQLFEGRLTCTGNSATLALGGIIYDGLNALICDTINFRQRHLAEFQKIHSGVSTIMDRIEGFEPGPLAPLIR